MSWYEPDSDRDTELADEQWQSAYAEALEHGASDAAAEQYADAIRDQWWRVNVMERRSAPREYDEAGDDW